MTTLTEHFSQLTQWQEDQKATLCAELAQHVEPRDGFDMIHHPLVVAAPYMPGVQDGMYNRMLEYKREALAEAHGNRDWHSYIMLHERPYRLNAFLNLRAEGALTNVEFCDYLAMIWTDCENPHVNQDMWTVLFKHAVAINKANLMDAEELKVFNELPGTFMVYRGQSRRHPVGLSWTLDYKRADWFRRRFKQEDTHVLKKRITREQAVAYFNGRSEQEIILLPEETL